MNLCALDSEFRAEAFSFRSEGFFFPFSAKCFLFASAGAS
jgi:hypothetical protein